MSTFNKTRFLQALKCHFLVERKSWIRLFAIFTLVMFMANLYFTRVVFTSYSDLEANYGIDHVRNWYSYRVEDTSVFAFVFFCFAMLFGASGMFSQMKDTRKRSAYLLWPVSNLEKYIIGVLLSVGLMMVLTFAANVLADALRVLVDWATGRVVIWGFTIPFTWRSSFPTTISENWQLLWAVLTYAFYFHSLYIVGGTLFRRQQFLFTSGTIVVVGILLIMVLNQIDWPNSGIELVRGTWDEATHTYTRIFYPSFYIVHAVLCLLILFHYWASYKLFCRMQVINNKWLNV
jgi:hypothetical protein